MSHAIFFLTDVIQWTMYTLLSKLDHIFQENIIKQSKDIEVRMNLYSINYFQTSNINYIVCVCLCVCLHVCVSVCLCIGDLRSISGILPYYSPHYS